MSRACILSKRVKNARQRRAKCVPTSTQRRSIRVLHVELEFISVNLFCYLAKFKITYDPHMKLALPGPRRNTM